MNASGQHNDAGEHVPEEMQAVEISAPGGPEVLRCVIRPVPRPARGEVLVRVHAASVNRPDCMQRQGLYPPPPGASDIPGLDIAGEVVAVGPECPEWQVGDRVCALVAGGGYAEYCLAPALLCLPVPARLSFVEAASLPEVCFTVWFNLFVLGRLKSHERVLIHGGGSGIGTMAIQLAAACGATVFCTVGSADKQASCEGLGAAAAINYRTHDFEAVLLDRTQGQGVDVVLDMVGGDYFPRHLRLLAVEGRLVQIAVQGGAKVELNLWSMMAKRLTITGSTLRARSVSEKAAIADAVRDKIWPVLESGRVKPVVDSVFPLAQAAAAHVHMESGAHFGKIILQTLEF